MDDVVQELRRQIRIALVAIAIVLSIGVTGFMALEHFSLLDAVWITVVTLTTVGYGDIVPHSAPGRIFTIFLILTGLSIFAYGIQAGASFFLSPAIRDLRQARRAQKLIDRLSQHYILCGGGSAAGTGEMVDKTIDSLVQRAATRREAHAEQLSPPVHAVLDRLLGQTDHPLKRRVKQALLVLKHPFISRVRTLLDVVVVVTSDAAYANRLRSKGLMVVEGDPSSDEALEHAGVRRASSLVVMLDSDTEAFMTVLTARSHNPNLYITAATLEEELAYKTMRVGANAVVTPYDIAGQFLNNTTLRPAVNDFFNNILFNARAPVQTIPFYLWEDSPWIGKSIGDLNLKPRFGACIIGVGLEDGTWQYVPADDYTLSGGSALIIVSPARSISAMQQAYRPTRAALQPVPQALQRLSIPPPAATAPLNPPTGHIHSLMEAESAVEQMTDHYILCGSDRVARHAIRHLNPEKPFVVISDDNSFTSELLKRGFRVIHGSPIAEQTLRKAGVERALAIMISIEDRADSVLAVVTCRALSKRLLITATATTDDMPPKLHRAGADRVVSPFHIAAQFVLLATTRPDISAFFLYVLFNYHAGIETTELYMQDDSPWIGRSVGSLELRGKYNAGVIGVRLADGSYLYAPPEDYVIGPQQVLIVVTPMQYSDDLRIMAHGSATKRPNTLRTMNLMYDLGDVEKTKT